MNNPLIMGKCKSFSLALCVLTILMASCSSKNDVTNELGNQRLKVEALVEVDGAVVDVAPVQNGVQASVASTKGIIADENMVYGDAFDALTSMSVQQTAIKATVNGHTALRADAAPVDAPTELMKLGKKFRVVFFNAATNALVRSVVMTSGQVSDVTLDGGTKYNWYAYSFNTTVDPPEANSAGVLTGTQLANQDVLHDTGSFTALTGDNFLKVKFRRLTVRYEVEVDAKGMFQPIFGDAYSRAHLRFSGSSGAESAIYTGDLNIFTGNFNNYAVENTGLPITSAREKSKLIAFHSAKGVTVPANKLRVELVAPRFEKHNMTALVFPGTTVLPIKNTAFTSSVKEKYGVGVKLIQSAVLYQGTRWGHGNLYRGAFYASPSEGFGLDLFDLLGFIEYHNFMPNQYFWNWKSLSPTGAVGQGDPCVALYPNGTWRLPTAVEALKVASNGVSEKRNGFLNVNEVNSTSTPGIFFGNELVLPAGQEPVYGMKRELYFPIQGYRVVGYTGAVASAASVLEWNGNVRPDNVNGDVYTDESARFWTSDGNGTTAKAFVWKLTYSSNGTQTITNFATHGTVEDMDVNNGLNVRCVRN